MKLITEVVVTNMQTGHVAINQHSVEIFANYPTKRAQEASKGLRADLDKIEKTNKVGDLLITRNFTIVLA